MDIYKITLLREVHRPRLAIFAPYLEIVTFIRAVNLRHARDIANDMVKEHFFIDCIIECVREDEFVQELNDFLKGGNNMIR